VPRTFTISSCSNSPPVSCGLSHYSDFEAMPSDVCNNYINGFVASRLRGIVRCLPVSKFRNEKTSSDWDPETIPYASRAAGSQHRLFGHIAAEIR
jgi:hypothetical protein